MKIELAISKRFRDVQVSKIRGKLRKFSHQEFFFKNNMPQKKKFSVRKLRNLNRNSSNLSSGMQSQQNKAERRVNWSAKTLHFLSLLRFADKRKSENLDVNSKRNSKLLYSRTSLWFKEIWLKDASIFNILPFLKGFVPPLWNHPRKYRETWYQTTSGLPWAVNL